MNTERSGGAAFGGAAMISNHGSASMAPTPLSSVRREMVRSGRKCMSVRFGFQMSEGIAFHELGDERGEAVIVRLGSLHDALDGRDVEVIHGTTQSVSEKVLGEAANKFISLRPAQHVLESDWPVEGGAVSESASRIDRGVALAVPPDANR